MGHGDEVAIVDANFPAVRVARALVRWDGVDAVRGLSAVLSVLPLDDGPEAPAVRMGVTGSPDEVPTICEVFSTRINASEGKSIELAAIERDEFYERAARAAGVIVTGEQRLYGNILLRKGVLRFATEA